MLSASVQSRIFEGLGVILVEDDETLRELLSGLLMDRGAECISFGNAEDALVHLLEARHTPDLVIADHGVPGSIKGLEFAGMIHEKWPELPILLTSGYQLDIGDLLPPIRFLFKPWSVEDLVSAIDSLLSSKA